MPEDTQEPTPQAESHGETIEVRSEPSQTETSASVHEPEAPVATAVPVTPVAEETVVHNGPGTLVLQWLTYAFWGWTVLALAWLTAISVGFFLNPSSTENYESTMVSYSLAAVVVLFVISLLCDIFYTKLEPLRKTGAAMVIMIIHAVIFGLFGIGSLIVAVFAVVRLLIGDSSGASYGDSGAWTTLITGLVIAIVYGATLLRTLRPFKLRRSSLIYWIFMAIVTVTITALGIAGPTWNARLTRDDRLIERTLPSLSNVINSHAAKTSALPKTLTEVRSEASEDARTLIDRNLVEYTPGKEVTSTSKSVVPEDPKSLLLSQNEKVFAYQLCVTYKAKKGPGTSIAQDSKRYPLITPDTYQHDAGRVCYDLQTSYSGVYY